MCVQDDATFRRLLDTVIVEKYDDFAVLYFDNIIFYSETFEDHIMNLRKLLQELRKADLQINVEKSEFFKKELRYLGTFVGGIKLTQARSKPSEDDMT